MHDNFLELFEVDSTVPIFIMFLKYVMDVFVCEIATVLRECLFHIGSRDLPWIIDVKLVEDSGQSLISQVLTHIYGCSDEFTVINSFVFGKVQLFDDAKYLLLP